MFYCKKLNCFGGTAGACNQNQDSSWSHKVGYCGADSSPGSSAASGTTSKQLKTIDTTQLFWTYIDTVLHLIQSLSRETLIADVCEPLREYLL